MNSKRYGDNTDGMMSQQDSTGRDAYPVKSDNFSDNMGSGNDSYGSKQPRQGEVNTFGGANENSRNVENTSGSFGDKVKSTVDSYTSKNNGADENGSFGDKAKSLVDNYESSMNSNKSQNGSNFDGNSDAFSGGNNRNEVRFSLPLFALVSHYLLCVARHGGQGQGDIRPLWKQGVLNVFLNKRR